jgi:glutathione S-transferase
VTGSSEGAPRIRLYTYAMSPYAAKVHCFLLYKRLEFECFYVDPLRAARELPVGRQVPVLTVDGESRADSTPIGLWLDALFPDRPALVPTDPAERARVLALDEWATNVLIPGTFRSYPGAGIDRFVNGWHLSRVMAKTAHRGLPLALRIAWPLVITRVPFMRRLLAMADDGRPPRESKLRLYDAFLERLGDGPFLGGRSAPSLPDFSAYPQFALFWAHGFRGGEDVRRRPALMRWLGRMRPYVSGDPPLVPPAVGRRPLP